MAENKQRSLLAGIRITSAGTLLSRVLGMIRDIMTAALFGLDGGGVMDAFALAFRLPNLARRLFGEGALTASFLPVFTAMWEKDRPQAWQLASVLLTWLSGALLGLVLLGELICWLVWQTADVNTSLPLLAGLTATMLPYMAPVCLAAQVSAMLNAMGHFRVPALAPLLLNVCWIAAAGLAPYFTDDKQWQAYGLASAIVISGGLQLVVQWPVLKELGFRWDYQWQPASEGTRKVLRTMYPMLLGLAVTQLNTLADSLIAFSLAAPSPEATMNVWGNEVAYPLQPGANAAVYFGERLYQFPLGLVGMAVATVIYPLLSRHAARGDKRQLGEDLTLGLRLVLAVGVPASLGLVMMAQPVSALLFQRGEFTALDAERTAAMIAWYSSGVWAYCALSVLVRGYYAIGDYSTPVRVGMATVGLNLVLNLVLIWPLAEVGLALATSATAMLQVFVLGLLCRRYGVSLNLPALGETLLKTGLASLGLGLTVWLLLQVPALQSSRTLLVLVPSLAGLMVHLLLAFLLRQAEWHLLLGRQRD